jgi:hypothetical protein
MAKRKRDALGDFAEKLGRLLGTTERKATALLAQRNQVEENLTAIRDKASELLERLSSEHPFPWQRKTGPAAKKPKRKGKTVKKSARKTKSTRKTKRASGDRGGNR